LLEFTQFDGKIHPFLGEVFELAVVGKLAGDVLDAFLGNVFGVAFCEVGVA
jgi:hypothetical protein